MSHSSHDSPPAFGHADLSNCEREQIHLAGSIQPHGALLVVCESTQVIVHASRNAQAFLHQEHELLNRHIETLDGNLAEVIRPHMDESLTDIPTAVRCTMGSPAQHFDSLLHRPASGGLIIELERAGPPVNLSSQIERSLSEILAAPSLNKLCDETARIFKQLLGVDRAMVYRFDSEGHGEVYAEQREVHLEAFLGNHYPASDIPRIARRLYMRNRVRVLVDVDYEPVELVSRHASIDRHEIDMSLCFLRSMSPIHIQYLKNMGVCATLVTSLVVGDRLWGLIACHHYSPRFVHYEIRAVCELLAEAVATRIAALESFVLTQSELSVRRLEQRLIESISRDGDWRNALFDSPQSLLGPLDATGAALLFEDQVQSIGEVPGTQQLRQLSTWLDRRITDSLYSTASLSLDDPRFAPIKDVASGVLAAPISNSPGEYLMWFRPERIRTITWGGNPFKPIEVGSNPADLSPRRSFSQWHQLVEGTSTPWTAGDSTAARLIGASVGDVVHQFRSVRLLIAQNQLHHITEQLSQSDQPVIIATDNGKVLLTNPSLNALLGVGDLTIHRLDQLPLWFDEPDVVASHLRELIEHHRPWRGEILTRTPSGTPLLVRADPVFSAPDHVLGFVVLFTDLKEQKAAESARRRFQQEIIERHRVMNVSLDSQADLLHRNLLSSIVDNAQLAALEITDSIDLAHVPNMLDSIKSSVARSSELLEHLIWHASQESDPSKDRSD